MLVKSNPHNKEEKKGLDKKGLPGRKKRRVIVMFQRCGSWPLVEYRIEKKQMSKEKGRHGP
jgi:hypothetical protein